MLDPILRQAIEEAVRGSLLENWRFYGLVAVVSLVAAVIGNFLSAYVRKRGEALATKADFEGLLDQLRTGTKATEDIKVAVQHSDWISREWKVVRRTKLEELLDNAYATEHWIDASRNRWFFQGPEESVSDPMDKVKRLCALYFPELKAEVLALSAATSAAVEWILKTATQLAAAGSDVAARQRIMDAGLPSWATHYGAVIRAISQLEEKATDLMARIRDG